MASDVSARTAWSWRLGDRALRRTEPLAVGIVNVTADSMYEGSRSPTPERAIAAGRRLAEAGFEMLDVGAVAARSGPPVPAAEEIAALVATIEGLAALGLPLSADTFVPEVAGAALAAGAAAINDIGGGSEGMFELVARSGCGLVLMHIEGPPRIDRPVPAYDDVIGHLLGWFGERIETALAAGVAAEQIAIDPGLDFDLRLADDLEILARLGELRVLGRPLYVSLSRKDFLGAVLAGSWEDRLGAGEREWATAAATALAVSGGADLLRLHDTSALQAMRVAAAISAEVA
jgi:dihydropteroate synthase